MMLSTAGLIVLDILRRFFSAESVHRQSIYIYILYHKRPTRQRKKGIKRPAIQTE